MLHRYAVGDVILEPDATDLDHLLDQHPRDELKRGCGVAQYRVCSAPYGSRGFQIVRTDGSTTDFSYRKCINHASLMDTALRAMRAEVDDDILRAKRDYFNRHGDHEGKVACAVTGTRVTIGEAHADHAPPYSFNTLSRLFLASLDIVPDQSFCEPHADN